MWRHSPKTVLRPAAVRSVLCKVAEVANQFVVRFENERKIQTAAVADRSRPIYREIYWC